MTRGWKRGENTFFERKTKRPRLKRVVGRLLISPPPSAAQEQSNSAPRAGKWLTGAIYGTNG